MRWPSVLSDCSVSPSFLRTTPARKPRTECACQPVATMIAVMVVPFGRLNSASTAACFDLRVLCWTAGFACFAFDRPFAAERGFALARALLLDLFVGSAHGRGAPSRCATIPRRPAGAGGGEELAQPGIGPSVSTTDAPF